MVRFSYANEDIKNEERKLVNEEEPLCVRVPSANHTVILGTTGVVADFDTRANTRRLAQTPPKHQTATQLATYRTARRLPHNSPPTTQLASDIQLANGIKLVNGIELAHCHTACPPPRSSLMVYRSPTATAYQLPQS
jgi:hypothetical protein